MTAQLDTQTPPEVVHDPPGSTTAARLVRRAAIVAVIADLFLMAIIQAVIPPLALFAVATAVVLVALRTRPRALLASLAVIAVLANAGGVPFWSADVLHPSDTVPFLWAVVSAGSRFVVMAAAALALWRPGDGRVPRLLGTVAIGFLAVAVVGSVTARAMLADDVAQAGDVTVEVEAVAFPERITAGVGDTLFVNNQDPFRHTFTVEGTDVDVPLAPSVARRVPLDVAPGSYQVICTVPGHEAMTATLVVTS